MKIENLLNDIDALASKREHLGVGSEGYGGGYNRALQDLTGDIKEYLKEYIGEIIREMREIFPE